MSDSGKGNSEMMHRIHSSFGSSSSSILKNPFPINHQLDISQLNPTFSGSLNSPPFCPNVNSVRDSGKGVGIPPFHPNQIPPISPSTQIPLARQQGLQNFNLRPGHSRSLSQPSSFFSYDSLPPLSPSPFGDSPSTTISSSDTSIESRDNPGLNASLPPYAFSRVNSSSSRFCESLPPKSSHRRSNSDIHSGFNVLNHNSRALIPQRGREVSVFGEEGCDWFKTEKSVKRKSVCEKEVVGERKSDNETMDDSFSEYMNLDNIITMNSSFSEDYKNNSNENQDDMDITRASVTKTHCSNNSDTEGESSANESGNSFPKPGMYSSDETRERIKRSFDGDGGPMRRHYRSLSMDSCFMEKLNFGDASPKMSPTNSADRNPNSLYRESENTEFTSTEMQKLKANEKLAEIALSDPKRVKRILANRQSAARSKERKMRYIVELEHKVQTLQTEATTLSAQLTHLQRDSVGLTNYNNELKFRLQAMEQQSHLRDALNERLTAEVQRLKLVTNGHHDSYLSKLQPIAPAKP